MAAIKIVGIGSSAGGLQALEAFFSEIPDDLGMAYVVVQHLSPDHPSTLHEILARCTNMPVMLLEKGRLPLPNEVYVKTPNQDIRIIDGQLHVINRQRQENELYLPIDSFFTSLANDLGERAVAIVLSGTGSDGSRGLKDIKERGGLTMAQSPESASFDGMPNAAIRQNICDVVLSPAELAVRLAFIARHDGRLDQANPDLGLMTNSELVVQLLAKIQEETRIDFSQYREATIRSRLEKRMLVRQQKSLHDYTQLALADEEEMYQLRQSFLIGVTRFFRDMEVFEKIKSEVLPKIIQRLPRDSPLRIWVPACSSGEEAYSLAMIVQDYLAENGIERDLKIFASDVDRNAIQIATRGEYDRGVAADIPVDMLQKYFKLEKNVFRINPTLREKILFAVQNLLLDPPFINVDLVSCRNFLIYIKNDTQLRVLTNFHFALKPSAFLLLGPSENLGTLSRAFDTVNRRWNLYRKKDNSKLSVGRLSSNHPDLKKLTIPYAKPRTPVAPAAQLGEHSRVQAYEMLDNFAQLLSERYAPPSIFVNADYEILYLNGEFEGLLHLPKFHARMNLASVMDEDPCTLFQAGVDTVLKSGKSGIYERVNVASEQRDSQWARVHFSAVVLPGYEVPVALIEVVYEKSIDDVQSKESDIIAPESYSPDKILQDKINNLERELQTERSKTQKLLNELEATNEELQTSNRELLASNEEMQSTNEELYTVNNELQLKNEELRSSQTDISNLLKSTKIGTVFLDRNLEIRRFTPAIKKQFDLHSTDIGRPITSFSSNFSNLDIEAICQEVLAGKNQHEEEIVDRDGNYFLLRVLPYHNDQDKVDGLVITFVGIDDLVTTRKRLIAMARMYEAILDNAQDTVVLIRENSRIEEINHGISGYARDELIGSYFLDLLADDIQRTKFTKAIRSVFDEEESIRKSFRLIDRNKPENETLYVVVEFIPSISYRDDTDPRFVDRATLFIRDVTAEEEEKKIVNQLLKSYKEIIENSEKQGGLMDLEGNIVHINRSRQNELSVDEYLQKSVYDFLTPTGRVKYEEAMKKIINGSFREVVAYEDSDLVHGGEPVSVEYQPVIGNGEIIFISVNNLSDDAE